MRTNNRPQYCIVYRRGHADEYMGNSVFRSKAEAKRQAIQACARDLTAEVCELTTVYEVKP